MSTGAIIAIIVIVALIVVAAVAAIPALQRARMRREFGPEYDRLAKELGAKKAGAELSARLRRAEALGIHPLSPELQARYSDDWTTVQERFVDQPAEAVSAADTLIWDVMRDRGYPADDRNASTEALSVYHASAFYGYRQVSEVNPQSATTEDLRQALIRCRALFEGLLGAPDGALSRGELPTGKGASTAGTAR
ncbi:MAG: hypothetical protein ACRDOU_12290 [Streptosporangiaceae bacterium]